MSAEFFGRLVFIESSRPNDDHVWALAVVSGYCGEIVARHPACRTRPKSGWFFCTPWPGNTRLRVMLHKKLRHLMSVGGRPSCYLEYRLQSTLRSAVRYLSRKSPIFVDGPG